MTIKRITDKNHDVERKEMTKFSYSSDELRRLGESIYKGLPDGVQYPTIERHRDLFAYHVVMQASEIMAEFEKEKK